MANIHYTDSTVAKVVGDDIINFAKAIAGSYCQSHPNAKNFDPSTYAVAYFNVFKQSLQALETQIEAIRAKENEELTNQFK